MKFLLTNDDGFDAPGLAALEETLAQLGELIVIAPNQPLSGVSHQTTIHRPVNIEQHSASRYSIDGTPADCVRIGLLHIAPDTDWVLSGINDGGNLGVDVFMSGTVAAAREAAWLRTSAMAISQYRRPDRTDVWEVAKKMVSRVMTRLLARKPSPRQYWNVNLPDLGGQDTTPEMVFCGLDPNPLPVAYREVDGGLQYSGVYGKRKRQPHLDVDVCFSGRVAITEVPAGT